jgi:hypothetical protein
MRNAKVVRVCERMRGSMGRRTPVPIWRRPVKTALPKVAAMPQVNAARAIKM